MEEKYKDLNLTPEEIEEIERLDKEEAEAEQRTKRIAKRINALPPKTEEKTKATPYWGCIILILLVFVIILGVDSTSENKDPIEAQFSSWDGSHRQLKRYTISRLKDPDSFQHIQTKYTREGEYVRVYMKYRAKNSFGGYVVNYAYGKYTKDGIAIEESL